MTNTSYLLAFETLLAITAVMSTVYLIFIRTRRELVLKKFKLGSTAGNVYRRFLKPSSLAISVVLTILLISNLVFALHRELQKGSSDHFLVIFVPILCVAIFLGVFFIMLSDFKEK